MQDKKCDIGISERFKIIREELRLKQKDFADRLAIKQTDVSKIENCRKQLDSHTMKKMASVFQISINWIVAEIGPKFIYNKTEDLDIDPDPEVAELVQGAKRVLTSGNRVAYRALEQNIRYFDHAIAAEQRADETEKKIEKMEEEMELVRQTLEKLQIENQRLDSEDGEQSSDEKAA